MGDREAVMRAWWTAVGNSGQLSMVGSGGNPKRCAAAEWLSAEVVVAVVLCMQWCRQRWDV